MSPGRSPILAINSGSSTLKFGLFTEEAGEEHALARGSADGIGKDTGKLEILDGEGKTLRSENKKYGSQNDALSEVAGALAGEQPINQRPRVLHIPAQATPEVSQHPGGAGIKRGRLRLSANFIIGLIGEVKRGRVERLVHFPFARELQ